MVNSHQAALSLWPVRDGVMQTTALNPTETTNGAHVTMTTKLAPGHPYSVLQRFETRVETYQLPQKSVDAFNWFMNTDSLTPASKKAFLDAYTLDSFFTDPMVIRVAGNVVVMLRFAS